MEKETIDRIEIKSLENGFIVRVMHKPKPRRIFKQRAKLRMKRVIGQPIEEMLYPDIDQYQDYIAKTKNEIIAIIRKTL